RPKAGVFAVRQARPLFVNLRRFMQGDRLKPYSPQRHFLSLIGTADGRALAVRASWMLAGVSMWKLKDAIDRRFMNQFHRLTPMNERSSQKKRQEFLRGIENLQEKSWMRCSGCAAK